MKLMTFLLKYLRGQEKLLVKYLVCVTVAAFASFLEYAMLGRTLDQLVVLDGVLIPLGMYAVIASVSRLFGWRYKCAASRMTIRASAAMRTQLSDFVVEKQKIHAEDDGAYLHALTSDITKVAGFFEWGGGVFVPSVIEGVVVFAFALTVSWKLMLCFTIGLPIWLMGTKMISNCLGRVITEMESEISKHEIKIQQDIRHYEEWIAQGLSEKAQRDNLNEIERLDQKRRKAIILRKLAWFINNTKEQYFQIVIYVFGGYLILHGEISIGMLLAFNVYSDSIKSFFSLLFDIIPKWNETYVYVKRLESIWTEDCSGTHCRVRPALQKDCMVSIDNLRMRIDGKDILRGVDLYIPSVQLTCIVGHSGAGKTTLANIMVGLYTDYEGCVYLKGKDGSDADGWSGVYFVPQFSYLFPVTMFRNFQYSNVLQDDLSIPRVKTAMRQTCVEQTIEEHGGLQCDHSDANVMFSGGEKKKIAIAQGLSNPLHTLILDEPLAGLDVKSRTMVCDIIADLPNQNVNVVLITHDYELCARADCIVVMEEGRIVAQGTHNVLMKTSESYRNLRTEIGKRPEANG